MDAEDPIIRELWSYCSTLGIDFHESIGPRRVPGRGLGIYANGVIAQGERIVHVPTPALFTTNSIPKKFASTSVRKSVPVHALLAAYFAFGPEEGLVQLQPWLETWPQYGDFAHGTPLAWPERCRRPHDEETEPTLTTLPPPLTGAYLGRGTEVALSKNGSTTSVPKQAKKLNSHIQSLKPVLDADIYFELQNSASAAYYRFLHAWLCINTRCFSYTPYGKKRPTDANEAMALCPAMDLFNHAATPGIKTKYDRSGYSAIAARDHQPGEEILLNYGQHVNDVLWTEYGFLLDENPDDAIRIDSIVLAGLHDRQKTMLRENGYLNEYWLNASGVCYRTEVVAWLLILDKHDWSDMLEGKYDPEHDETLSAVNGKRTHHGHEKKARKGDAQSKSHRIICADWVAKVESDAVAALKGLTDVSDDTVLRHFGDDDLELESQAQAFGEFRINHADLARVRREQATQRHKMCVKRWSQLRDLASTAKSSILGG